MSLGNAWEGLKNSASKAVSSASDPNRESEQKLEERKEKQKEKILEKANKELINAWENQNWETAENISDKLGYNNDQYIKLLSNFIILKETKGEEQVDDIKDQLENCEKFLEKAIKFRRKGNWEIVEQCIKKSANLYTLIEKNQLLDAQRDISHAENAIKHYNRQIPDEEKAEDKKIHSEINEIDKSISQAQEFITDILEDLKNRK